MISTSNTATALEQLMNRDWMSDKIKNSSKLWVTQFPLSELIKGSPLDIVI